MTLEKILTKREFTAKLETRADGTSGAKVLTGVIPYQSRSENLGGFFEVIAPTAFNHTLSDGADVKCLVDHDSAKILGRVKNGTLKLDNRDDGLYFEVTLANTSHANDVFEDVRAENISAVSFAFIALIDEWDSTQTPALRTLKDVKLIEISFVTFPAYPESKAAPRSLIEGKTGVSIEKLEAILAKSGDSAYQFTDDEKRSIREATEKLTQFAGISEPVQLEPAKAVPDSYYSQLLKKVGA